MCGGGEMNNKYLFNGENWIVTSGEIEITPLHGTRPLHPALSKKLYNQNMQQYTQHKKPGVWWLMPLNAIKVKVTTIDKYTIVELTHNNKHHHGLASMADCDKENAVTGIAVAYHRAFEKMMDDIKDNDDLSPVGTAYFKNKDWVSYDLPAKKLKDTPGFKKFEASTYRKSLKRLSEDKNIPELIHESINALMATGKEPTEIRIKPVAAEKLRREFEIKYEWFGGERFIEIEKYFGLKYIIDPSIDVDIIII